MSKLNEEIIDCFQFLLKLTEEVESYDFNQPEFDDLIKRSEQLLHYFEIRRHIEECRRDEEVFND